MTESFTGFPEATIKFFRDLEMNNSRTWFESRARRRPSK